MGAVVVWFGLVVGIRDCIISHVARKLEIYDITVLIHICRNLEKWINNDLDYINYLLNDIATYEQAAYSYMSVGKRRL